MQTALSKSIIQNLGEVNPFLIEGIEGTETEDTLKSAYILLNPRITKKVQSSEEVIKSKKYRKDEAYILMEMEEDSSGGKRISDIRPFKTLETLLKIITDIGTFLYSLDNKVSISYLFTPNPVRIPRGYYIEYKNTRDPDERKRLATKYELLLDKSILNISYIVLDIDSPFEEVYPVWKELVEKLGIKEGYIVYKTKSGRFRAYLKVSGKFNNGEKTFKLTPHGRAKNGRKHIINAYEIQYILAAYFEKRGLNYDNTFAGRLNHPVWLEETSVFDEGKSQLYEIIEGETPFYSLYNRVKKLQKKEGLWKYKGENIRDLLKEKEEEFTQQTTGTKQATGTQQTQQQKQTKQTAQKTTQQTTQQTQQTNKQRQRKITKSKLKMTDLEKFEEAVKSLKRRFKTHRFTKIMLPAVGWGKYLGLEKDTIYEILKKHIPTKRNFSEDFEKAWKYGDPLEFVYGLKLIEGIEIYLKEFWNGNEKLRKELKERFGSEADYYEAERYLITNGYIEAEYRKTGGRGRPQKIIKLTEKGINLIQDWKNGSKLKDLLENDSTDNDTDNNLENYFTQYNYSYFPIGKQSIDTLHIYTDTISDTDGLVGGWLKNIYTQPENPSLSGLCIQPTHLSVEVKPSIKNTHPVKHIGQTFKEIPTSLKTYLLAPLSKPTHLSKTSKNNLPVKLTTDLSIFDKQTTIDKPTSYSFKTHFKTLSTFDKQPSKTISTFDNLSEYDKTIIDETIYDEKTTSKNLSTFDNLSEPLNPAKDKQPKKSKDKAKKSLSKNKQKQKSLSKKPQKKLSGGGLFTREARIMAIILGYEKDQMGRAVSTIAKGISYFYQKNHNLEEAIYRTFALYIHLSEKFGGKKVFLPVEVIPKFEDESLKQMDKVAWGYLLKYKEKYNLQQKRQKQKQQNQKQKQKKLL